MVLSSCCFGTGHEVVRLGSGAFRKGLTLDYYVSIRALLEMQIKFPICYANEAELSSFQFEAIRLWTTV